MQSISTGGRAEAYTPEGFHGCTMRQLLAPIERTALLCGMRYLPPFVVHGTHRAEDAELDRAATDWRRLVLQLRDGQVDPAAVAGEPRLDPDRVERLAGAGRP